MMNWNEAPGSLKGVIESDNKSTEIASRVSLTFYYYFLFENLPYYLIHNTV